MQASQDVRLGGRATRTQFEFTLQDANLDELNEWAPKILAEMQKLPQLRDVATDQQTQGTTLTLTIDRDTASRYGIQPQLIDDTLYDAFGQRQVTQYFTQLNSYHVILEILPELQGKLDIARQDLYQVADDRRARCRCRCSANGRRYRCARCRSPTRASFRRSRSASTSRENVALGQATDAIQKAVYDLGTPGDARLELPGHRAGVPAIARHRAAVDPGGAGRGLPDPRRAL